jgi:hypothetical protein
MDNTITFGITIAIIFLLSTVGISYIKKGSKSRKGYRIRSIQKTNGEIRRTS